jgi:PilZ domain-containing protein
MPDTAREYYRIAYPAKARPKLEVLGFVFEVLDLSERGIRFRLGDASPPEAGFQLQGTVTFVRGVSAEVTGTVLRVRDGQVAAVLDKGVPPSVIRAEQRFLLENARRFNK